MKPLTGYITIDGAMHTTYDVAVAHLNALYKDVLRELASEVTGLRRDSAMEGYIDKNLVRFRKLMDIKDDMRIQGLAELSTAEQDSRIEAVAKGIYAQWALLHGWTPWDDRGTSDKQEAARKLAREALNIQIT